MDINSPEDKSWTLTAMNIRVCSKQISPGDQSLDINSPEDKSWTLTDMILEFFNWKIALKINLWTSTALKINLGH